LYDFSFCLSGLVVVVSQVLVVFKLLLNNVVLIQMCEVSTDLELFVPHWESSFSQDSLLLLLLHKSTLQSFELIDISAHPFIKIALDLSSHVTNRALVLEVGWQWEERLAVVGAILDGEYRQVGVDLLLDTADNPWV